MAICSLYSAAVFCSLDRALCLKIQNRTAGMQICTAGMQECRSVMQECRSVMQEYRFVLQPENTAALICSLDQGCNIFSGGRLVACSRIPHSCSLIIQICTTVLQSCSLDRAKPETGRPPSVTCAMVHTALAGRVVPPASSARAGTLMHSSGDDDA